MIDLAADTKTIFLSDFAQQANLSASGAAPVAIQVIFNERTSPDVTRFGAVAQERFYSALAAATVAGTIQRGGTTLVTRLPSIGADQLFDVTAARPFGADGALVELVLANPRDPASQLGLVASGPTFCQVRAAATFTLFVAIQWRGINDVPAGVTGGVTVEMAPFDAASKIDLVGYGPTQGAPGNAFVEIDISPEATAPLGIYSTTLTAYLDRGQPTEQLLGTQAIQIQVLPQAAALTQVIDPVPVAAGSTGPLTVNFTNRLTGGAISIQIPPASLPPGITVQSYGPVAANNASASAVIAVDSTVAPRFYLIPVLCTDSTGGPIDPLTFRLQVK